MKKKRLLTLMGSICLVLVLVALLLPACAKEEAPVAPTPARPTPVAPTPAPTPTPTPAYELPDIIAWSVCGVGTTQHTFTSYLSPIMEECLGVKVRVIPSESEKGILGLPREGKAHLLCESPSVEVMAQHAEGEFATEGWGPQPLVGIWRTWSSPWGVCVLGNSPIKSFTAEEMRGKRFACFDASPAYKKGVKMLIEEYLQLTLDDVVIVPFGSYKATILSLAEGKSDIVRQSTTSSAAIELEANPRGVRWLPMDDEEAMKRYTAAKIPVVGGIIRRGVESAIGVPGVLSVFSISCYPAANEELVYQIAKFMAENFDKYKDGPNCEELSLEGMREFLNMHVFPMHKGSIRYLKEIGLWSTELDKWNGALLKLQDSYAEAWKSATAEAKVKGIKVNFKNEEWMELWKSYQDKLGKFRGGYGRP